MIPKDTRAGTAKREIQKQHHERTTSVTAGENTEETKYSNRRLNENTTLRLANEPAYKQIGSFHNSEENPSFFVSLLLSQNQ